MPKKTTTPKPKPEHVITSKKASPKPLFEWVWDKPDAIPGPALKAAQTQGAAMLRLHPADADFLNVADNIYLKGFETYCFDMSLLDEPFWLAIGKYFENLPRGHYWRATKVGGSGLVSGEPLTATKGTASAPWYEPFDDPGGPTAAEAIAVA